MNDLLNIDGDFGNELWISDYDGELNIASTCCGCSGVNLNAEQVFELIQVVSAWWNSQAGVETSEVFDETR